MFQQILKLESVYKYLLTDEYLIYVSNNNFKTLTAMLCKLNLKNKVVVNEVKTDSIYYELYSKGNIIFCKNTNNNVYLMNDDLEVVFVTPFSLRFGKFNSLINFMPIAKGNYKTMEFGVYDFSKREIVWMNTNPYSLEFINEVLIGQSKSELCRIDPLNGNILWKTNFGYFITNAENIGLFSILGISKNILVVGLENIDKLIAISLETGKVIWEKSAITSGKLIDYEKDVLHSFLVNYTQLSIETGEQIDAFVDRDFFESIGIESNRSNYVLDGDHIITTDNRQGNIGAFNTITHKFDWVYRTEEVNFPAAFPIVCKNGYLCVLDNKNTLHIFEKESV